MGKLSREVLQLACDKDLVRNVLVLRKAIEAIEEEGIVPEGHDLIEELSYNLQVMEEEVEQRGLKKPEDEQRDFLQGEKYDQSREDIVRVGA